MTARNTVRRSKTVAAFVIVAGAVILGLFAFNSQPSVSAQTDTTAPTISSIAISSDPDENDADLGAYSTGRNSQSTNWASGVYRIGDDVQVTVTFSENVTVTGSPQLELAIGTGNRTAEYESTDGSAVVFSYTVVEGHSDSNGIAISADKLTLNGGSIMDTANNNADLSHNALADQVGHEVDGIRPRISRLFLANSTGGNDGAYSEGEELIIVAVFTEDFPRGSVTGPPRVKLDFNGEEKMAPWDISLLFNSPRNYGIFSYVVQERDLDSDGVAISANSIDLNGGFIRDTAGNDAVLTHSAVAASSSFIVDAVAPTVSSITITSDPGDDATYGTGDKIEVTVTFSENMSLPSSISCSPDVVHCKAELELDIGGTAKTADYESHSGADVVYAYTVQVGDKDDNGIAIGVNKLTGQQIKDATGKFGYGVNDADLNHSAVADDAGHKVSSEETTPQQHPDLELGTPSVDDATPSTLSPFTLSVTVTNAGDGESEATMLRYYRSTDSTITSSDSEEDTDAVGALAAAGTSDHSIWLTAPSEVGTYYYGACVDSVAGESDTANNCSSSVTVTVPEPEPDLVVLAPDVSPSSVETGGMFSLLMTVTNQGDAQSAATTLRYKRSTDATIATSDTSVGTDAVRALVRPQGSGATIRLTAPSTPGTYYYGGCVDSVAGESDTANNCSSSVKVTVTVPQTNTPATSAPTISGTARVGQTLTADTSGIQDANGLDNVAYSYQWLSSGDTVIEGATSPTYTLQASDSGKTIKVRVTFTDDAGNEESLTSAATVTVTVPQTNTPATGAPTISGTTQVGQTLTASTSGIADDDGLTTVSYNYEWLADDIEIGGATSSAYTLRASDSGKAIKVRVTFTDDAGSEESLTSAATNSVTASVSSYDANENGVIEKNEVIAAINDYLDDRITKDELIAVIKLYLFG